MSFGRPTSSTYSRYGRRERRYYICSCGCSFSALRMEACPRSTELPNQEHTVKANRRSS